jgi:hypothetical protein
MGDERVNTFCLYNGFVCRAEELILYPSYNERCIDLSSE